MNPAVAALFLLGASVVLASEPSPYAGEASNPIQSLSADEINGLMEGKGMGFARAAELNHFPGPRHVLELADALDLSEEQIEQTRQIFETMRDGAVELGARLVDDERALDALFATGEVSASALDALLLKSGETRAKLRGVHLKAHLEMKKVLSHHQVMMYDHLRGYTDGTTTHPHAH